MKKQIKKLILFIGSFFSIKNVIVFESHADYSDNSRSFFEYLIENGYNEKYKIYWFVNNANNFKNKRINNVKFLTMWSKDTKRTLYQNIKYFWIVKNAKYLIFSNRTLHRINSKTKTIYINHGIAIKKLKGKRIIPVDIDYDVESSDFCVDLVIDQQGIKKNQVIVVGNPRNDVIFKETNVKEKVSEFSRFEKIILWLPTFRKSSNGDRNDSNFNFPLGIPIIYSKKKLLELNEILKKINIGLILKPHPAQDLTVFNAKTLSNIIIMDDQYLISKDVELTEFYKITDALITDYSSVYVDYLLTQKPIGFTQDDFNDYKIGFSMNDIQKYMPGFKIIDFEDLKKFIFDLNSGVDKYAEERERVNRIFNKYNDDKSSERLARKLKM